MYCRTSSFNIIFKFEKNDEIITTPMTFASTINSIILAGAKPILADIQSDSFNIDPKNYKKITKKREQY